MPAFKQKLGLLFIGLLRPFLNLWLGYLVNWKLVSTPPKGLKPPYLIISTHVSVFEMPLMLLHTRPNPMIVLHELHLIDKAFLMLLSLVGAIWRKQGQPDPRTIRQMRRAIEEGRSVLIYPEGDLNWDGCSLKLDIGMARACRFIGAPVLVFKTEGSYLGFPRWAHKARRGRVDLRYTLAVGQEDYARLTDAQILEKLNAAFVHSEREWVKQGNGKGQHYKSSKPALGLERLLYLCPACGKDSKTGADDGNIWCSACGFNVNVDADLKLGNDCERGFRDVWDWHDWQDREWKARSAEAIRSSSLKLINQDISAESVRIKSAVCDTGQNDGYPHRTLDAPTEIEADVATLSADGITLAGVSGEVARFIPMSSILSVQVFIIGAYNPNWLIIMTDDEYVKIQLKEGSNPCYPWLLTIREALSGRR